MRISLKKFTTNPYKYAKKAPLILVLGDEPAYALIPYVTYKEYLSMLAPLAKEASLPIETKPHGWLYRLLFS